MSASIGVGEEVVVTLGKRQLKGVVELVQQEPDGSQVFTVRNLKNGRLLFANENRVSLLEKPSVRSQSSQPTPTKPSLGGGLKERLKDLKVQSLDRWAVVPRERHEEGRVLLPHVRVTARAGTGKTTTLMCGLCYAFEARCPGLWEQLIHHLGFEITPSPQQQEIWDELKKSADEGITHLRYAAFNNAIVKEFSTKWGWVAESLKKVGITLDFTTNHSTGYGAVRQAMRELDLNCTVDEHYVRDCFYEMVQEKVGGLDLPTDSVNPSQAVQDRDRDVTILEMRTGYAVARLVSMCKLNLLTLDGQEEDELLFCYEQLERLAIHYSIQIGHLQEDEKKWAFDCVMKLLDRCQHPERHAGTYYNVKGLAVGIDFDDMIWLPVVRSFPMKQYDLLLVDESQDLNACQQSLLRRSGRRIIFVGDDKQAINGFAGAATEGMDDLTKDLGKTDRGVIEKKLTVTRRCAKRIVQYAKQFVPDFEAHESNSEGRITRLPFLDPVHFNVTHGTVNQPFLQTVKTGDMILCRNAAPLMGQAILLLRMGIPFRLLGSELVEDLLNIIKHLSGDTVQEILATLLEWRSDQMTRLSKRRHVEEKEYQEIEDRYLCLGMLIQETAGAANALMNPTILTQRIQTVFNSPKSGSAFVTLATIHKAKGLEANQVFIINTRQAPLPNRKATLPWEKEQERNLCYVAATRAKESLIFLVDVGGESVNHHDSVFLSGNVDLEDEGL